MMATTGAVKDDWVKSAMKDGGMVAEFLLRLKEAQVTRAVLANPAVPAFRWGIRQPRSRSLRCDGVSHRREADSAKNARCSPTTPLSWSGGCCGGSSSPSANADGYEVTSGSFSAGSRSKILVTDDSTNAGTNRLRRKKTVAELKEEESVLLKERICLRKDIASLRATVKEQSATSENLKRMRLALSSHCSKGSCASDDSDKQNSGQPHQRETSCLDQTSRRSPTSNSCKTGKTACARESGFLLPDLNMIPSEDDLGTGTHYTPSLLHIGEC